VPCEAAWAWESGSEMTVREANLTASTSADREPELIETAGTARLHLTLATADYDHVRDLTTGAVRAEGILCAC
jgi:hypothetical protein